VCPEATGFRSRTTVPHSPLRLSVLRPQWDLIGRCRTGFTLIDGALLETHAVGLQIEYAERLLVLSDILS